jgi:hypothetical protein
MNRRYESFDEKGDPLVAIAAMVLWESFQPKLKAAPIKGAPRGREAARKNLAGTEIANPIFYWHGKWKHGERRATAPIAAMSSKKSAAARGLKRRIQRRAYRNRERSRARKAANEVRAKRRDREGN